jgi:concanavalin A-like lectin/glucanase superfamily protein/List-Bact-rpt repeat protein/fibronectin type III domain protein
MYASLLTPRGSTACARQASFSPLSILFSVFAILLALALPASAQAQTQRALRFESSATPRYLTFGAAPSLGCSTFTIEIRFKRTSTATVGITASTGTGGLNAAPLVTKGRGEADNSNLDCNYFVGLDAGGRLAVDFEEGAGQTSPGLNHPMFSLTAVTDTLWHHAAVTFDGSATGTMRIYLDGVLDSTKVVGAKRIPRWDSIQHAGLATAMTSSGLAAGNFQGILDEARIWGVARTSQQINDNKNLEILQGTALLGRWGLNEGSGASAGNSVPNGVSGTLNNGPLWTTDSTLPQVTATGLRFGGTNAYVTFGNAAALGASTFTLETWFRMDGAGRPTSTGAGGLPKAIPLVAKGRAESDGSNVDMNYFMGIDSTTTRLVADFEDAATGANHPVTGSTTLSSGVWYHAAATFDGDTFRLYLNGALEGSVATTATPRFDSIQHAGLGSALNSTGVADGFLSGSLDEARIWTAARSQADIISTMNSELTGPVTGLAGRWGLNEDGLLTVASSAGSVVNGTITGTNWAWAAGSPFDATPPAVPADPTGLTANAISTSRIDLAWSDNASNEGSYEVERSTTGIAGTYSLLVTLPVNSTSYSNTGLTSSTEYCYRVRAVNGVGPSGYAGPACATTATPTPPAPPSGLVATAPTYGQAHLAWTDNSGDEASFELERSTAGSGGPFTPLATLSANTTAYDDLNRNPGTEYCYRVRAVNGDGASAYDGPACVTTPVATAGALDLTGGAYTKFGNPAELRLTAFTIEMWLRRDGAGSGTNTGTGGIPDAIPLVAKGRAEAENAFQDINYLFGIRASDGVLCADFEEGAGGASPSLNHPITGVTAIPATGVWHHVAATYDGATWNLYLDGNLDASLAVNRPVAAACTVSVALGSALTSGAVAAGSFDGPFDEVRVWNVARTQAEIRATANAQLVGPTSGLAARWSLDEGSGAIVNGSAGTQVAGTITGGSSSWISPAPFNLVFAPDPPSGLAATALTSTRVNLSWTDNANNEASYQIERSTTGIGGTYSLLATVPANTTSYADTSLTPSTEYCYRVRGVNTGGSSAYAGPACATTLATFTLTVSVDPSGSGSVARNPDLASYESGSPVELTASAATGYHFVDWTGDLTGSANPQTLTMSADRSVTAQFAANTYTLTYTAGANGTIVGTSPQTVSYNGSGTPVTATPSTGYHFVSWSDAVLTASRTDANVTVDLNVTATFAINTYTLVVSVDPDGSGSVAKNPDQALYDHGAMVQLTATPAAGYSFVSWSGDTTESTNPISLAMNGNKSVTAHFALNAYTLATTVDPPGSGSISKNPDQASYSSGSSVELTASAATGYHFVDWSGDLPGSTNPQTLTMDADKSVTAHFAVNTYTLTYTSGANGTMVGTSPQTVSHGGSGTLVTATPNTGYHFVSWSDGVLTASRTDTNVTADLSVTANFAIDTFTLTYTAGANGTIVGSSPQTVSYGGSGTLVTATPNTGYHFVSWSDGVLTAARTEANVTADLSVTATFEINTYTLTYTAGANGTIVGSSPQTVSHGGSGTLVTATPNTGYHFLSWSDGVLTAARTDANVTADLSVTAAFEINPDALAFSGTNAYVNFGDPAALRLPAFTLEMWLRRDGTGAGTNTGTGGIDDLVPLISKGRAEAEDPLKDINYIMGIRTSTGVLAADFEEAAAPSPNPSLNHPILGATPLAIGSWYHVAATYDGSSWRLYVNGTLDAELAVGRATASTSNVAVALASALNSTAVAAGFFNGVMDEVRVWSTARSANEIAQTINARLDTPTPGLVGRWSLDEGTGTVAHSTAGTVLDGAITGTGWAWASGAPFSATTFTISASAGAGGTIAPAGSVVVGSGNSQAFTITPDACHDIADVLVDGSSAGAVGSYTFPSVGANHTIAASFSLKTFTISATAGAGGTVSPAGATPVNCGANQSYTITPDAGYHIADVLVDGVTAGAVASYTFTGVAANHTIAASFALNPDALAFTGTNGYVNFGSPAELSLSAFTLEMWMRRDGPGTGGDTGAGGIPNLVPLIAKGRAEVEDPLKDVNYALGIRASDGVLAADFEEAAAPSPNPSLNHPVAGVTPLTVGTWYHVAATYDGTTWRLYVNGALDAQLAVGRAPASTSTVPVALASMLNSSGTAAGFFQGTMDEVRVWNGARTQADIIAAMNLRLTSPTAGLVARWGLDEGTGTIVHSSAGSTLDGNLTGTGWSWATGAPFDATPPAAPAAPTALQATPTSQSQVNLAWTDNASNETGFEIERSTSGSGGPFSPLSTVGANIASFNDTGLSAGTEYCYRVRAVNGTGVSSYAGPACATTSAAPTFALSFGGNTYVTFGDPAALDLAQFTLECWFRRDGAGATTSTGSGGVPDAVPLVTHGTSQSDGSNVDMNFFLGIKSATSVLCADFEEGAGGSTPGLNHPVLGTTPIVTGTWYHAAATYDGTTWRLYLNGNLEAQLAVGQPVQSASIQHAAIATSITSTGTAQGYFNGVLDEVRIWSTVRTLGEIQSSANIQIATAQAGLAARWGLDEGAGTAVNGSAGTAVNGTVTGASFAWVGPAPFNLSFTPPASPTGLAAAATSFTQIDLSWTDNSGNESTFEIERSTTGSGGAYTLLATVGANTTTYPDVGLSPSTEYCYRVRAANGSGVSGYDGPACATTPVATSTALDLAGNTYVNFGDPSTLRLQTFTIEMWLRRDGAGVGTNTGTGGIADAIPLIAKGRADAEDPTRDINYILGIQASTGVLCADFEEGAAGTTPSLNHPVLGGTPIATGGWHHVAATYDGESWNLYLDGIPDGALTVGQPPASASIAPFALGSALTTAVGAAGFFDGAVDEVRIWNVARTLQEIQSTANAKISSSTPGLVGRWSLDEGSGTAVNGSAGTTINGTVTGTAFSWVGGAPFNLSFNLPPTQPILVSPSNNATNVTTSPTLVVTVSDPDGQPLNVDFYGRAMTSVPGPDFTIVGVPDTQYYTSELNGATNAIFLSQTNWIVSNRASRNIVYVATLGDCVEHGDNGGNDIEWQRADLGYSAIENPSTTGLPAGLPYGVTVGNHDQSPNGDADGTTTFYNQYFGESRFLGRPYYGGHYGTNNDNWYDLFSASGMDFIVISLEYDTTPDAAILSWADNLLTTYASRRAIILSHNFAGTGNPATFSTQGQATYNALRGHSNLFLMLCGHVPGEGRRQDTFSGNTVNTVMSDYQGRTNGGNGWLRIMEFSPANNVIRVKTYSPWLDQFEADADSSSQFSLLYNMSTTTPYALIGNVPGVASGSNGNLVWSGLQPNTPYEWYATASDGAIMTTGSVSRFTTTAGATYALTTTADLPAGGTVGRSPNETAYLSGASVTLTATPAAGYEFRGWCGDASGATNPLTIGMTGNKSVSGIFNEVGAPTVQVLTPNGGQTIQRGSVVEIHWTATDAEGVDLVDVLLSRSGPSGPWEPLGSGLPGGATSFTWAATGPSTTQGFIRVIAHNPTSAAPALTGWDVSDAAFTIMDVVTGVEEDLVTQFALRVASSNPIRDRATIAFALPRDTAVRVDVIDVQGRLVANVVNRRYSAGRYTVDWMGRTASGSNVASGVYFLRFTTPERIVTKRFTVVR